MCDGGVKGVTGGCDGWCDGGVMGGVTFAEGEIRCDVVELTFAVLGDGAGSDAVKAVMDLQEVKPLNIRPLHRTIIDSALHSAAHRKRGYWCPSPLPLPSHTHTPSTGTMMSDMLCQDQLCSGGGTRGGNRL